MTIMMDAPAASVIPDRVTFAEDGALTTEHGHRCHFCHGEWTCERFHFDGAVCPAVREYAGHCSEHCRDQTVAGRRWRNVPDHPTHTARYGRRRGPVRA